MDEILKEELLRSVGIFGLAFMTYPLLWAYSNKELPAVGVIIVPLVLSLGTLPLRVWYRRWRHEG
ncbi:hypothetical protein [Thermococcus sp.]